MIACLKITKVGNSAGVLLSDDLLTHLGGQVGDMLSVVRTSRGLELSKSQDESSDQIDHADQLAASRKIMRRDRKILSALAKS